MASVYATASATLAAPAAHVYGLIADYHDGHSRILPRPPFGKLIVEEGGTGAGTLIRFTLRLAGRIHTVRARITEPEPGRVLAETSLDTGSVTTFTVEPEGDGTRVTITTAYERAGVQGVVERLIVPGMLRKLYVEELQNLAREAVRLVPAEGI